MILSGYYYRRVEYQLFNLHFYFTVDNGLQAGHFHKLFEGIAAQHFHIIVNDRDQFGAGELYVLFCRDRRIESVASRPALSGIESVIFQFVGDIVVHQ